MRVPKRVLSPGERWLRFLSGISDPRAWMHLLKLVSFYNHSHVQPLRRLQRGSGCQISPTATFAYPERISLGDRVLVGEDCRIWAGPSTGHIKIGADTMLGPGVLLTAANYRFRDGTPVSKQLMDEADVVVGADVWIGARVTILPGAVLGDGAVVGAGSVVRGVIPSMSVAVGIPARVRGSR
jgi:acetyltransferase-like isoleucine patch superfamily enzyme